jgi:manganese/zinc/iron transport system permease protein
VCAVNLTLVVLLWKELKASTFDPDFAQTIGIRPVVLSRLLLVAVAITAVISFEPVGAILVVTMIIVPATTAYLLTDSLRVMVVLTVALGWASAVTGYAGATTVDASIPGSMGLAAVVLFLLALLATPRYGLLSRAVQRRQRAA